MTADLPARSTAPRPRAHSVRRRLPAALLPLLLAACGEEEETPLGADWNVLGVPRETTTSSAQSIRPLEAPSGLDERKVGLGEKLYHDPRLSGPGTVSCATCHILADGGDDNIPRSIGAAGHPIRRNAPTVFNAALHFRQFWDGRAATLEEQMDGPINSPEEMDSSWEHAVQAVSQDEEYRKAFEELYGGVISEQTIKNAIATFERSLITTGSRFDRFLQGDASALNEQEKRGWEKFRSFGCVSCHQGVAIGGNMFQKFGVFGNPFAERGDAEPDYGRYEITGREEDKFVFKVPSLRNVAVTAPYFHDGSVERLEDAVAIMMKYQLGREPNEADVADLVAFLRTLTGQWRGEQLDG